MAEQFISEPLRPVAGGFDAEAMSRGEPGLPAAFVWHDAEYRIAAKLGQWKHTSAEGARAGGDVYLRRHYYRLAMSDGSLWVVYFVRQSPKRSIATPRWFLYTIEPEGNGNTDTATRPDHQDD